MSQGVERNNIVENTGRTDFLNELAESYQRQGYEVLAVSRSFPRESEERMGVVDLLLEDTFSTKYRVVEATETGVTDPAYLRERIQNKEEQAEKAKDYFRTNIDPERIDTEVVVRTEGRLDTVRELFENSTGVFTWDQAVDSVSDTGRLGNLKRDGGIVLNHEVSREENEEYFELSADLEKVAELLADHATYP